MQLLASKLQRLAHIKTINYQPANLIPEHQRQDAITAQRIAKDV
jgi:hypothetical protein